MTTNPPTTTRRASIAGLTVAALGVTFAAGMAFANQSADPPGIVPQTPVATEETTHLRLANADLTTASTCDDLLDWYIQRGLDRVTAYGWDSPVFAMEGFAATAPTAVGSAPTPTDSMRAQVNSETGTNVQEAGVDEPDIVKTNGELLVRAQGDTLATYDVTGDSPQRLAEIELPDLVDAEVLLAGDTVVAIGTDGAALADPNSGPFDTWAGSPLPSTRVLVIDVSDPQRPLITRTSVYDSHVVTARQHGDVIRLILSRGLPNLDFTQPRRWWRTDGRSLEHNRQVVRESTITDWLPSVTTYDDGGPTTAPLVDCRRVALPEEEAGLGTMTVVGFSADDPANPDVTSVATSSQVAYASTDRLYLATNAWSWWGGPQWCCVDAVGPGTMPSHREDGVTQLFAFELAGTATEYVASGEVEGQIADRWAMDETGGVLRVAVGPTSSTGNFNSVVVLTESGNDLVELGRLDKLGVNEQIKSVRWFDDLAILVTFRQTDPLYVIDLSTPSRPRLEGELKIPGFSEYLHPLGPTRLIGVGQDASLRGMTRGAQAALFNISDVSQPEQVSLVRYRKGTSAQAGMDPRQFTWLPDQRTALTVITQGWEGQTGWVSELQVDGDRITNTMHEVEYGNEVTQVRLVPLPSGRVVLVTGDEVSFFPLGDGS